MLIHGGSTIAEPDETNTTRSSIRSFPRIVIAATHSGTGKTTLTCGIISALRSRGLTVQGFKVGPDYIDPGFHTRASGRMSRNLDTIMMNSDTMAELFARSASHIDISVIEGVMGLFDGLSIDSDRGSTAEAAKLLKAPVILCIDASGMARSAAALALGFVGFDKETRIAGFIFNRLGSEEHYRLVKEAVENATGLPVLGYLPEKRSIALEERHLGLVPAWEEGYDRSFERSLTKEVESRIDLDRITLMARQAPPLDIPRPEKSLFVSKPQKTKPVLLGIAYDEAFHFYYQDNLDILASCGAECVPVSPLRDTALPEGIGGLYLGGGYPELFAKRLQDNEGMREAIRAAAERGLPIYAECGGLMYLMDRLVDAEGNEFAMAGIFRGRVSMGKRCAALGYYTAAADRDCLIAERGWSLKGHVFHWSELSDLDPNQDYALRLTKPGKAEVRDGLMYKNVLAGYFHMHFAGDPNWALRFVKAVRERRK